MSAKFARGSDVHVVWFKRDLRIHDHEPLARACAHGPILPLYVVEPELWQQPDMAGRHWAFVRESLAILRRDLAKLGQPLVVRIGNVTDVLDAFRRQNRLAALWSHEETGNAWTYARDRAVAAWCRSRGIPWHELQQTGVTRRLASRDGWAKRWESLMTQRLTQPPAGLRSLPAIDTGAVPSARDLSLADDPCPGRQTGGRDAGIERLESFLTSRGEPYRSAMSSPVTGFGHCSRISPHLAWGTLSLREVVQATRLRQRGLKTLSSRETGSWRGSLSAFSGRLHWRSHFMQKLEDEPRLEYAELHPACRGLRPAETDTARLNAWASGETGLPFVDACMRALNATGWMNFRMRAMLMAVASYHLWLDWREPGVHLARLFTDYEPGIHWPQVQMQSGTTGINAVRIYNPVKQGLDQDPDGAFVRRWIPELAPVPEQFAQEPWRWDGAHRVLGKHYPFPIVDHLAAAKQARQKIWAARKDPAFRSEAGRIQAKHGSRRRGESRTRGKRPEGGAAADLFAANGGSGRP